MDKFKFIIGIAGLAMMLCGNYAFAKEEKVINYPSVHDPSVIKDGGKYYVFGSHIAGAKSDDMMNWEVFTNGYTTPGNTLFKDLDKNLAGSFLWAGSHDCDCLNGYAVWAPEVYYNKNYVNEDGSCGAYVMYYSASSTYKRSCIGMAVSKNIEGPYTYVDTILYSGFTKVDAWDENSEINKNFAATNIPGLMAGGIINGYSNKWGVEDYSSYNAPNCIDPCIYESPDGRLWMSYGSWSGGIFVLELDKGTGLPIYPGKDGGNTDRYFGKKIAGGKGWSGEGSYIYYDEEAGYYFLQDSYEWLGADGGYHIRIFRSKNPDGPFTDGKGNDAIYGSDEEYPGVKLFGNYKFDEMDRAHKSGGHSSLLVDDDNERYLFYHTRFSDSGEFFEMRVRQLFLNEDNWLVAAPHTYRGSNKKKYDTDMIDGIYQFIDHKTEVGVGHLYKTSQMLELMEDGSIRGCREGRWSSDGYYITLELEGNTFKGVLFEQENEAGDTVMTFSALGGNNAVWGSRTERKEDIKVEYRIKKLDAKKDGNEIFNMGYIPNKNGIMPAVILCHGYNSSYRATADIAERLAEKGIAAYVFDFTGGSTYSKSGGSPLDMSIKTETDDLKIIFDLVREEEYVDKDRIYIYGESQGGLVASLFAAENSGIKIVVSGIFNT